MMLKRSIIDIWQGFKYGSAASFFNIFPLSSIGYLNEYMNILFFFSESVQLLCSRDVIKNFKRYTIDSQTTCLLFKYHGITKYSYIHTIEMR